MSALLVPIRPDGRQERQPTRHEYALHFEEPRNLQMWSQMCPDRHGIHDVELAATISQRRLVPVDATLHRRKSPLQVSNRCAVYVGCIQLYRIASEVLQDTANTTTEIEHAKRLPIGA